MTAFAYSTGDPTKITGAQTAAMTDVKNSFTDITTYVNGGNLDATYMAAGVFAPPRTIEARNVNVVPGDLDPAYTKHYASGGNYFLPSSGPFGSYAPVGIQFDPADYAITGKTLAMRLVTSVAFATTIPSSDLTVGLYPVSSIATAAGAYRPLLGTAVTTSTWTPVAGTTYVTSGTFAAPVAGSYCFGAVGLTIPASCYFTVGFRLGVYWT